MDLYCNFIKVSTIKIKNQKVTEANIDFDKIYFQTLPDKDDEEKGDDIEYDLSNGETIKMKKYIVDNFNIANNNVDENKKNKGKLANEELK